MIPPLVEVLYAPVVSWVVLGVCLLLLFRKSTSPLLLRIAASFAALWAVLATTVMLWVVTHGGVSAALQLLRSPLRLFAPEQAGLWAAGVVGAFLVFAVAFGLNQFVGRGLLALGRAQRLPWPPSLPEPPGRTDILLIPEEHPEAFSIALLRFRAGTTWHLHRQEVIFLTTSLVPLLEPAEIEAVVAHELAHLKGLDARYLSFLRTLARMMRWDPLLGYVSWRLSRREELIADREATRLTGKPQALARALGKTLLSGKESWPAREESVDLVRGKGRRLALERIHQLLQWAEGGLSKEELVA